MNVTHCIECGTRLLIVVFPPSLQYDTNHVPSFYEDHLLERVTLLELKLSQAFEKLEGAYDFIGRILDSVKKDHVILQSFLDTMKELNPDFTEQFSRRNLEIFNEITDKKQIKRKKDFFLQDIYAQHNNPNAELFKSLLNQGIELLKEDEKQAFQMLERAVLLSPENVPLRFFIAEKLFRAEKNEKAKDHLEIILKIEPNHQKMLLLLGIIYADEGQTEKSRRVLSVLASVENTQLIVNYVWAMNAAFEGKWAESIAAFKEAVKNSKVFEIEYLIGCAYFQLKRPKMALRHLDNATELNEKFSDAWFMKSLIFKEKDDETSHQFSLEKALENAEFGGQSLEYLKGKKVKKFETALPFIHFKNDKTHILTNGALFLTKYLREQLFKAIE